MNQCGLPSPVLIIDFETFFSSDYHLGRDAKALSTIEYVQDSRFEVIGCGFLNVSASVETPDYENETFFQIGEEMVETQIRCYQKLYGQNLERCTVVAHNAIFDTSILSRRYGICCPAIIDTLGLARHWHSRSNNDLDALAKRHKLPEKGDTAAFKDLTLRQRFIRPTKKRGSKMPVQMPIATQEQLDALAVYGRNDCMREWELFTILLPLLSRPEVEIRILNHTLNLFLRPVLEVNYAEADRLVRAMNDEMDDSIRKVMALYGD